MLKTIETIFLFLYSQSIISGKKVVFFNLRLEAIVLRCKVITAGLKCQAI